jgi:hypothetical protein
LNIQFFVYSSGQTLADTLDQARPVGALRQREVRVVREAEVAQSGGAQIAAQRFEHALGVLDWKKKSFFDDFISCFRRFFLTFFHFFTILFAFPFF